MMGKQKIRMDSNTYWNCDFWEARKEIHWSLKILWKLGKNQFRGTGTIIEERQFHDQLMWNNFEE